jgi:hypothetical protein
VGSEWRCSTSAVIPQIAEFNICYIFSRPWNYAAPIVNLQFTIF